MRTITNDFDLIPAEYDCIRIDYPDSHLSSLRDALEFTDNSGNIITLVYSTLRVLDQEKEAFIVASPFTNIEPESVQLAMKVWNPETNEITDQEYYLVARLRDKPETDDLIEEDEDDEEYYYDFFVVLLSEN